MQRNGVHLEMIGQINKNISAGKAMAVILGRGIADTFARIAGFGVSQRSNRALWWMRPQKDQRTIWDDNSRYTGAKLREIRKRKGVGRPPQAVPMGISPMASYKKYPALVASYWLGESPNLSEWQRKQLRGESNEDYRARRAA